MIRSYNVKELEQLTGINRRTIGDYIAKDILTGPSHRGRGAVYPQRDLDILIVIPRLRTLLKDQFGSLKAVASFIGNLSAPDIHQLAGKKSERAFLVEVSRLRVRLILMQLMPQVAPEKFDRVLAQLTPEQLCAVDAGRQIGAVIDMSQFMVDEEVTQPNLNILEVDEIQERMSRLEGEVSARQMRSNGFSSSEADKNSDTRRMLTLKLDEITDRLLRVERMLETES